MRNEISACAAKLSVPGSFVWMLVLVLNLLLGDLPDHVPQFSINFPKHGCKQLLLVTVLKHGRIESSRSLSWWLEDWISKKNEDDIQ
jgi:hypothetical protein